MIKHLDVIIPIKNEAENLAELAHRIHRVLKSLHVEHRLIFVDDHSRDDSLSVLSKLARHLPIKVHTKTGRPGKAYSIFEGAQIATSEYVAMIDGDLQYPPESLSAMLEMVPENGVVVANRKIRFTSPIRRFVSDVNRQVFNRLLLGFKYDTQSGLKIFRREILSYLNPDHVGAWAIDVPLLSMGLDLGYTIAEVDINFTQRKHGLSHVNLAATTIQIIAGSIRTRFLSPRTFNLPGKNIINTVGAGMAHHQKRYITHSGLSSRESAVNTLDTWQQIFLLLLIAAVVVGLVYQPMVTAITITTFLTTIYLIDSLFSFFIVFKSLDRPPEITYTPEDFKSLKAKDLPIYTILCPLYKEAHVLPEFVNSISQLDWPSHKLEVILLLEEDDPETIAAAKNANLPNHFRILIVPDSFPKTKPKACNYGLNHAKGEYIVIYDAEDRPDPLQLKKAYIAFQSSPDKVVCLQGKLNYYNPHDNLLTRLFTTEYSLWFDVILPGLQSIKTTIPLGGTSNHFRTDILKKLNGWDAFNVTEDCDLGARLFKNGYQTALIDSTTYEEANSNIGNWIRQRSRWIKGYIQTFLVHNRRPLKFIREQGIHALIFQLIIGLRISFLLINPFLWFTTIAYFVLYKYVGPNIEAIYPSVIFYMALFSAVFGNFIFFYNYMIGCAKRERWDLIKYVYLLPLYWLMISFAAVKAGYQLVFRPHYWEKTKHGLVVSRPFIIPYPKLDFIRKYATGENIGAGVLVVTNIFTNFFNFLYNSYLSLSSGISLADFGTISLMGSFLSLLSIPTSALSRTVTFRSGFLIGKYQIVPKDFWVYVRSWAFRISMVATVIWLILVPWLPSIFGTDSNLPFFLFTPIWIIGTLAAVDGGYLTGNARFGILAATSALESVAKFIFTVVLVRLGLGHLVYASIPLASMTSFIFTQHAARQLAAIKPLPDDLEVRQFPRHFFYTSFLVRISSLAFLSLDIVLAKMFLTPNEAGSYALISLVGKMVYFAGSMFSQFVNPMVSRAEGAGKDSRLVFTKLLSLTSLASISAAIIFGLLGRYTAPLLYGHRILSVVNLLPWFSLGMVAFTLATNIVGFHQIRREYLFSYLGLASVPLQILMMYLGRGSLGSFVLSTVGFNAIYLSLVVYLHTYYSQASDILHNFSDFFGIFQRIPQDKSEFSGKSRILIFNWRDTRHIWAGGAEVYLQELAKRWVKRGHMVTIFCGNDHKSPRNEIIDGVKIVRRGGFFTVYFWAPIYYLLRFRGRYDIVIDSENGVPFFTPLFVGVPKFLLIHHVHQNVFRAHLKFPMAQLAIFLESKFMPFIYNHQKVITVSESSRSDVISLGLSRGSEVSVINPGINLDKFQPSLKTGFPLFSYLGRFRPYKNIDVAIKAFARILNVYPNAQLVLAGWGENLDEMEALVDNLKITRNVRFARRVSEKQKIDLMGQSWAMLQPSSFEGWGITVIEANACGTPVIASDVGGLRDSVLNQKTGILIPPQNPQAMADAMKSIITHENLRRRLSAESYIWAQGFNWDRKAEEFINVINSDVSGGFISKPTSHIIYAASE